MVVLLVGIVTGAVLLAVGGRDRSPNPRNDPAVPVLWSEARTATRELENARVARAAGELGADMWFANTRMRQLDIVRELVERTGLDTNEVFDVLK